MSKYEPQSFEELIVYIKRKLGEDIEDDTIEVDITENQFMDRIYETWNIYKLEHINGSKPVAYVFDTQPGITEYPMPNNCISVTKLIPYERASNFFSLDFQMKQQLAISQRNFDIVSVTLTFQYLKNIEYLIGEKYEYDYNTISNRLYFLTGFKEAKTVAAIGVEVLTLDENPRIFNDTWFKEYAVQACKYQYGENLAKYAGTKLPGSTMLTGEAMMTAAEARLKELREELMLKWRKPVGPIWR